MIDDVDADLLQQARTVDPVELGRRVRQARLAKNLTQTAVAGDQMSTAYISRIEAGQRRPDPELIAVIAERVGVGVDELVIGTTRDVLAEQRTALMAAEMALRTGSAAEALSAIDDLLPTLAPSTELRLETLTLRAQALEATGRLDDAILLLEDVRAESDHDLAWIAATSTLCRCYRETGSLARAIDVGEDGLRAAAEAGLAGTFGATRLALAVVAAHFESGDTGQATRLCRRAIADAEVLQSPDALAIAYWNASIIESRLGRSTAAVELGRKALVLVEIGDDHRQRAQLRTQLGVYQLRASSPDPADALEHLERAEVDLAASDASPADRAFNKLTQARARLMLGDTEGSRRDLEACAHLAQQHSPSVAADAHMLAGQIAMSEGHQDDARAFYRRAVLVLSSVGADRTVAQVWFELGALFEAAGETEAAADAYKRAGTSTGLTAYYSDGDAFASFISSAMISTR